MAMAKSTMVGVNICRTPAQRCSQQLCGSRMDPDARFSSARSPYSAGPNWAKFLATLGVTGAIAGPLLDGIHSRVHLQVYDSLPVDIVALDLHTSVFVPPLLAVFYMVLGSLHPLLDTAFEGPDCIRLSGEQSWLSVVLGFVTLAIGIETSAYLYASGCPYDQINVALILAAFGVWYALDRSKQGILLGFGSGVVGLLAEIPNQVYFGLWHYTNPDVLDVLVSWTFWCYFFYTPAVGNLARKIWKTPST